MLRAWIPLSAAAALIVAALLPLTMPSPAVAVPGDTWAVRGTLSDACQCRVFCPCELAEKPTFGHCDDTAILHIEEGHYGPVTLDGLRVVVVSKSPEGERLVDTIGQLVFAHMYAPEEASEAQAAALADLARAVFGTWVEESVGRISPDETVERVPMEVDIQPHRHRVTIPDTLALDIEALVGGDGENPVIVKNGPAAGSAGDILVARSREYRYTDHGIDWDYGGRSASIRAIDFNGIIGAGGAEPQASEGRGGDGHHSHG